MNCNHCNSSYTSFVRTDGDADQIIQVYHCDSCNRDFQVVKQVSNENDEWILTLHGLETLGNHNDMAKIVKKPDGTIVCQQKMYKDYKTSFNTITRVPDLQVKYQDGMFSGYNLSYSSYSWPNDPNGNLFIVKKVEYGPKLQELAKQNEALKILASNHYLKGSIKNPAALNDAVKYLREAIGTQPTKESSKSKGGCYVATAVYGSYDCPQVWILRRYRDHTLASTWYGRLFIRCYYAVSPTLVKLFGNASWFKNMWKPVLDKIAAKLKNSGVEDTPYHDRPQ